MAQMTDRNGPEDTARAIRRLEHWHRRWEILNRERLIFPTFASWDDITHEHDWTFNTRAMSKSGTMFDDCHICNVSRVHVVGTPTSMEKLNQALYDLKQKEASK